MIQLRKISVVFCLIALSLSVQKIKGQVVHMFSVNTIAYANYFNPETKGLFTQKQFIPSLSYRAQNGRKGIEVYLNHHFSSKSLNIRGPFFDWESLLSIKSLNLGVNYQRFWAFNSNVSIGANIGINGNRAVRAYFPNQFGCVIPEDTIRYSIGVATGIHANVHLRKNWYAISNLRFIYLPTARFNPFNLICEIGVGYRFDLKQK